MLIPMPIFMACLATTHANPKKIQASKHHSSEALSSDRDIVSLLLLIHSRPVTVAEYVRDIAITNNCLVTQQVVRVCVCVVVVVATRNKNRSNVNFMWPRLINIFHFKITALIRTCHSEKEANSSHRRY